MDLRRRAEEIPPVDLYPETIVHLFPLVTNIELLPKKKNYIDPLDPGPREVGGKELSTKNYDFSKKKTATTRYTTTY